MIRFALFYCAFFGNLSLNRGSLFWGRNWNSFKCRIYNLLCEEYCSAFAVPKLHPIYGARNRTAFSMRFINVCCARDPVQARSAWRWWNFYESKAPPQKTLLRINIDETSLCVHQGDVKGAIFRRTGADAPLKQRVSLGKRRRYVTFACTICDDARIQKVLPQFIVANHVTLKAKEMTTIREACRPGFVLIRQKSAWVNEKLFISMIRRIVIALAPFMDSMQPVLFFDCARLHLSGFIAFSCNDSGTLSFAGAVLRACQKAQIWPLTIPPKLTWRLQPLDTHCFYSFKTALQHIYQRHRAREAKYDVGTAEFLQCVYQAVELVIEKRSWHNAFNENGFGARQNLLSKGARADLCIHDASNVKEGAPTLEDMAFCFPRSASKSAHLARELFIECAESAGRAAPLTTRKQKEEYQAGFFMHDVLLLCMAFCIQDTPNLLAEGSADVRAMRFLRPPRKGYVAKVQRCELLILHCATACAQTAARKLAYCRNDSCLREL